MQLLLPVPPIGQFLNIYNTNQIKTHKRNRVGHNILVYCAILLYVVEIFKMLLRHLITILLFSTNIISRLLKNISTP